MTSPPPDAPGDTTGGATEPPPSVPPPPPPGPRVNGEEIRDLPRLRRTTADRKVAGVAGGIARHLDIDPVVVRIAFVVLVFFGGGGLLLYGACWLFVPEDRTHHAVVNLDGRSRTVVLVIAGVLAALAAVGDSLGGFGFPWPVAVAAVAVAIYFVVRHASGTGHARAVDDGTTAAEPETTYAGSTGYAGYRPPPAPDPRRRGPVWFWFTIALALVASGVVLMLQLAGVAVPPSAYPAVVMAACGVMLLVGTCYGRSGGLIPLGLVAAVTTLLLSLSVPFSSHMVSVGQTQVTPDRLSELEESYAIGMGEIKIDLTRTRIDGDHELDLDMGIGHVQVLVPETGLAVRGSADIVVGEIKVFDDKYSDVVEDFSEGGDQDWPTLTIDADGRIGQIEIITSEQLP